MCSWLLAPALLLALLAGCASGPSGRDGADANPPSNLERVPDAEPRIEPIRAGGPNKPYEVLGRRYVPQTSDVELVESGLASWYGRKFHGRPTALGETYDMYAMTAAHKTMPLPSYARVRNPANGREVIVRVNDRGPFADGRVIDLSYTAALKLGMLRGVAPVEVRRITFAQIREGLAQRIESPSLDVTAAAGARSVDDPAPGEAALPAGGFWLQLGAFRQRDAALLLQQRALRELEPPGPAVVLRDGDGWLRVQVGPYATRAEAAAAADRLQAAFGPAPLLLDSR